MQMRKKRYIFKHFAKSKKWFFCQYLSFSMWFLLKFKKKYKIEAPYRTQYSIQYYTYNVETFSWLLLSFAAESSASGPQSGKALYHSLPLPDLVNKCISVVPPLVWRRKKAAQTKKNMSLTAFWRSFQVHWWRSRCCQFPSR
jgi:hypothetical protein